MGGLGGADLEFPKIQSSGSWKVAESNFRNLGVREVGNSGNEIPQIPASGESGSSRVGKLGKSELREIALRPRIPFIDLGRYASGLASSLPSGRSTLGGPQDPDSEQVAAREKPYAYLGAEWICVARRKGIPD